LVAAFSFSDYRPTEKPNGNGYGTKHKGDSGLILPGDGEEMANTNIEPESIPELPEKTEVAYKNTATEETTEERKSESEETTKENKEEHNKVNEMIIAFWHGVAAVLIGEASALMVAFAWMKIRGGK
jgi:hypothetical protein